SDADPHIAEAFSDVDYRNVAEVAAQYYSIVLTDTGTGIVHAAMRETLAMADQVVVVTGLSVDEARLASETLTWPENNGHEDLAREAVVVVNTTAPGTTPVREEEIRRHFDSRVNRVVHLPYDAHIAGGGEIVFADLPRATREAARELAARVVENMRARAK